MRAAALSRIARNQRKIGRWDDAMRAYGELRALGPITVSGLPAELLARDAMCALFEERGDVTRLKEEASALYADLGRGRWKISEAAYVYYAGQARQRAGAAADTRLDAVALSEAAQVLWDEWQRVAQGGPAGQSRRVQHLVERPVLLAWRRSADRMAALAAGADFLESAWLQALTRWTNSSAPTPGFRAAADLSSLISGHSPVPHPFDLEIRDVGTGIGFAMSDHER